MMAHIFERYLTKTPAVNLTDRLCEGTLFSIIEAARVLQKDPLNYDARATICWAGTIAHNGILGVGRAEDWSSHLLEHELSAKYDATHGAGLAVMFPAFMKYTIDEDVARYRMLAVNVWKIKDDPKNPRKVAMAGIDAMKQFFQEIGMPTSFAEIGAKAEDIDFMVGKLEQNKGKTLGSFKVLTLEDAKQIYLLACK
jgi:alcohol dehydrogenase YqhD (iron-dependent ADH family)